MTRLIFLLSFLTTTATATTKNNLFKVGNRPEPVNKRSVDEDSSDNDDSFEVTKLLSKFKNIEQNKEEAGKRAPKPIRTITPPPADYK